MAATCSLVRQIFRTCSICGWCLVLHELTFPMLSEHEHLSRARGTFLTEDSTSMAEAVAWCEQSGCRKMPSCRHGRWLWSIAERGEQDGIEQSADASRE